MCLLHLRHIAVYAEQTHVLAHTLSVETETDDDDVFDRALALKPGDGLELFERAISIRQVQNALRCDSTAEEEGPLEIGRSWSALLAWQDETRGYASLIELQAGQDAARREVGHPIRWRQTRTALHPGVGQHDDGVETPF